MPSCFIRICLVLFLSIRLSYTEVTIEDGGYSNVLVAFSQNVPLETGMEYIGRMQTSLKEASEILYNAIGLQFSKVTFEIPDYWDISEYNISFEDSFNSDSIKANFLIDNTEDTVFGKFPFAQQYGSCNVPGHQIIVPTAFFDDDHNRFPKGISLAREWLKYRYGVFDENGYFDDPLYPLYYSIPGSDSNEVRVTDCSDTKILYNFTDQLGEECPADEELIDKLKLKKCVLNVREENLENVTSSLMYFQESITSMIHICDGDHQHNSRSPNKQNALCYGKSIGDIISQSSDFKDKEMKEEHSDIEFIFSKKAKQRVVVAWENTRRLESQGQIILNAITKLIIDLPDGSKFNAFPFPLKENAPNDYYTMKDLDGVNTRKALSSEIKSDFMNVEFGNYKDAITKAIEVLKSTAGNSDEPPGDIIIIAGNVFRDLIVVLLKDLKSCITTFDESTFPDLIEDLNLPCLDVVRISVKEEPEEIYQKLIETIERIFPSKVDDKVTETLKIEYLEGNEILNVKVDDFTETVTFSIFGDKEGDSFLLKLNEEIKKGLEEESYKNVLKLSYSPKQAGNISFLFAYPTTESLLVEVKKTSKPGKYFSGEVLVHDTTGDDDTDQMPVIIYAIVRFGPYPVQNAKVSAIIERPDGNKDVLHLLYDDGKGDPDITQNDGVYSRYYTQFSGEGHYTVRVLVRNDGSVTRYGADDTSGYRSCCGSVVDADGERLNGDKPNLNEFKKVFETTFTAKGGRPVDGYKPSRITDLRIDNVTDDGIVLKWTAPGEEADSGKASRYEIKLFCGEESTTKCITHKVIEVSNKPTPLSYGEDQQLKLKILDKTQILSISIQSFNERNRMSDFSNIIEIFRPSATLPEITTDEPVIKTSSISKTGTIVGWVIAGILIIISILGVVIYLRKRQQPKKPELQNTEENRDNHKMKTIFEAKDISIQTAPVKKIESFPVLLYTHDQIKDHKNKENDQPLYKSNVPPKQWKSLDVVSNLEKGGDRDTKSLGSSSTINLEEDKKGTVNNGDMQIK